MIRLALTMRVVVDAACNEARDALSQDWARFVTSLGFLPVCVPNALPDPVAFFQKQCCSALLLTGGEDHAPYREILATPPEELSPSRLRDLTEYRLLAFALEKALPVLAICRGFQLVNDYLGGQCMEMIPGHAGTSHQVDLVDSHMRTLLDCEQLKVNSYHRRGVKSHQLAHTLRPFAVTSDQIVEGYTCHSLRVLGLQWHPERPNDANRQDHILISNWIMQRRADA